MAQLTDQHGNATASDKQIKERMMNVKNLLQGEINLIKGFEKLALELDEAITLGLSVPNNILIADSSSYSNLTSSRMWLQKAVNWVNKFNPEPSSAEKKDISFPPHIVHLKAKAMFMKETCTNSIARIMALSNEWSGTELEVIIHKYADHITEAGMWYLELQSLLPSEGPEN